MHIITFSECAPSFSSLGWKRSESEEYCAITKASKSSCRGRFYSSVLENGFQLASILCTDAVDNVVSAPTCAEFYSRRTFTRTWLLRNSDEGGYLYHIEHKNLECLRRWNTWSSGRKMLRLLLVEESLYTVAQQFNTVYVMYIRRRVSALCICHHRLTYA